MQRIPEERISMLPGPPAVYQTILNTEDLDQWDMSSLRLAVTGAAAIPVEMIISMRQRLGFENIVTGYGLTESSGITTMCRHDDDPEIIANTSGRAIDGVEVRIVDPAGQEAPRGEPGEIVIRGYNVMKGYLNDPVKTAETIDSDGWLHTGDIGVMDAEGNIDITRPGQGHVHQRRLQRLPGRDREPDDGTIQGLHRAAVVGVPDERLGEVGYAFVVPAVGSERDAEALIAWCRTEMANYKVPRHVEYVDALPLNAGGKVLKYQLRGRAAATVRD